MLAAMAETGEALPTSEYWELMTRITRYSDNEAANELLEMVGGSEEGGAARMLELLHSLGLSHTFMAGGYLTGFGGGPPVVTVVDPPPSAYKYTTPAEMARVAGYLVSAAAGRGPLLRHGITPHEARQLLYLMVQAADAGLVPAGANGLPVAHKIGWLERHQQRHRHRLHLPRAGGDRHLHVRPAGRQRGRPRRRRYAGRPRPMSRSTSGVAASSAAQARLGRGRATSGSRRLAQPRLTTCSCQASWAATAVP